MTDKKLAALARLNLETFKAFSFGTMSKLLLRFQTLIPHYGYDVANWKRLFTSLHSEVLELQEAESALNTEIAKSAALVNRDLDPETFDTIYAMEKDRSRLVEAATLHKLGRNRLEEVADVVFCFLGIQIHMEMSLKDESKNPVEYLHKYILDPIREKIENPQESNWVEDITLYFPSEVIKFHELKGGKKITISLEMGKSILRSYSIYMDVWRILEMQNLSENTDSICGTIDKSYSGGRKLELLKHIFAVFYSNISKFGIIRKDELPKEVRDTLAFDLIIPKQIRVKDKYATRILFDLESDEIFSSQAARIYYYCTLPPRISETEYAMEQTKIEKVGVDTYLSKTEIVNHLTQIL